MGCGIGMQEQDQKIYFHIATLSYQVSNTSPFEYYSIDKFYKQNKDQKRLNKIFRKLLSNTNIDRQKIKQIDVIVKKQRYSPLYRKQCGIKDGLFQTKQQFFKTWVQVFNIILKDIQSLSKMYGNKIDEQSMNKTLSDLMKFDYYVYESIVTYLYEIVDIQKLKSKMSVLKYCQFIDDFFNKPHLQQKNKIQKIIKFAKQKDIDVFIIPNSTRELKLAFEKQTDYRILMSQRKQYKNENARDYQIRRQKGTMLLINEKSFSKSTDGAKGNRKFLQIFTDKHFSEEKKKGFFQNYQCVALSIDNFIFLGINLAETTQKDQINSMHQKVNTQNRKQILKLIEDLEIIRKYFPKKYIIFGGNMGIQVDPKFQNYQNGQQINFLKENFLVYPSYTYVQPYLRKKQDEKGPRQRQRQTVQQESKKKQQEKQTKYNYFTTMKKPSSMQLNFEQLEKNQIVECADQIFYDKRIKIRKIKNYQRFNQSSRFTIDGKQFHSRQGQRFYMPNQIHPFSNLVVVKSVRIPKRTIKVHDYTQIPQQYLQQLKSSSSSDRSSKDQQNQIIRQNVQHAFNFANLSTDGFPKLISNSTNQKVQAQEQMVML